GPRLNHGRFPGPLRSCSFAARRLESAPRRSSSPGEQTSGGLRLHLPEGAWSRPGAAVVVLDDELLKVDPLVGDLGDCLLEHFLVFVLYTFGQDASCVEQFALLRYGEYPHRRVLFQGPGNV